MVWVLLALALAALAPFPAGAAPRFTGGGRKEARYALVLAAVGDAGQHSVWLKGARFKGRNWDLALLYHGDDPRFGCKECRSVWRGRGPKWALLHRFLKEQKGFRRLAHRYAAVMVADGDMRMTAKELNKFFDAAIAFNLSVAQPSLCPGSQSRWPEALSHRDGALLHYTNYVSLAAPTFSGRFFDDAVRGTLGPPVRSGRGLDFVWPYLAGWGLAVGVVDSVCMLHPAPPLGGAKGGGGAAAASLEGLIKGGSGDAALSAVGLSQAELDLEEASTLARYPVLAAAAETVGLEWAVPVGLSEVPADTPVPKVNWRRRLVKTLPVSDAGGSHSGLAVLIVMLAAVGGLLLTGAGMQGRRGRRTSSRRRSTSRTSL